MGAAFVIKLTALLGLLSFLGRNCVAGDLRADDLEQIPKGFPACVRNAIYEHFDPPDPTADPPNYLYTCREGSVALKFPFCNSSLPLPQRMDDLISRIPQDQIFNMMAQNNPALTSIGLAPFNYTMECEHGMLQPNGTVFPQGIGMAASFNRTLWTLEGVAISSEVRGVAQASSRSWRYLGSGTFCMGPNINIARDPRWGRIQETPGEDPFLSGEFAQHFLKGMQGSPLDPNYDPNYVKIATGLKHIDAYSLERGVSDGVPYARVYFDAAVSQRDLYETYLPAFSAAVQGTSPPASYIAINGVPTCANGEILNEVVRRDWGYDGIIVADKGALWSMNYAHHWESSNVTVAADALNAGVNLDGVLCYAPNMTFLNNWGPKAVNSGQVSSRVIKDALRRVLQVRFQTGVMSPPKEVSYSSLGEEQLGAPEHLKISYEAARQTITLLQNKQSLLPLSKNVKVALMGPQANTTLELCGDYTTLQPLPIAYSVADGLSELGIDFTFTQGCGFNGNDTSGYAQAKAFAEEADVVIIAVGLTGAAVTADGSPLLEGEFVDREQLELPAVQQGLIKSALSAGKPVILVLVNGGPLAMEWEIKAVDGIIEAFYPGQFGGLAIAEVLFGDYAVAGRLPYTVYPGNFTEQIAMTNFDMRAYPGRTYKFYTGKPLFPFGFGLSYTSFQYDMISTNNSVVKSGQPLSLQVNVTNTGTMASDVSVLAFFHPQGSSEYPLSVLFGFERISLAVGETKQVAFFLAPSQMALHQSESATRPVITAGQHCVSIGGDSTGGGARHCFVLEGED